MLKMPPDMTWMSAKMLPALLRNAYERDDLNGFLKRLCCNGVVIWGGPLASGRAGATLAKMDCL